MFTRESAPGHDLRIGASDETLDVFVGSDDWGPVDTDPSVSTRCCSARTGFGPVLREPVRGNGSFCGMANERAVGMFIRWQRRVTGAVSFGRNERVE